MFEPQESYTLDEFLRDPNSHVSRLRDSKAPEALTIDGGAGLVVQDAESYGALMDELEGARFAESLRKAHQSYVEGWSIPLDEAEATLRAKHGF